MHGHTRFIGAGVLMTEDSITAQGSPEYDIR